MREQCLYSIDINLDFDTEQEEYKPKQIKLMKFIDNYLSQWLNKLSKCFLNEQKLDFNHQKCTLNWLQHPENLQEALGTKRIKGPDL